MAEPGFGVLAVTGVPASVGLAAAFPFRPPPYVWESRLPAMGREAPPLSVGTNRSRPAAIDPRLSWWMAFHALTH